MSGGQVPVVAGVNGVKAVPLKCGGTAFVKKLRRSRLELVMEAARLRAGDQAAEMRFGRLIVCAQIVGAEGLVNADGEAVRFASVKEGVLGPVASVDVYDALAEEDLAAIAAALAEPTAAEQEAQKGNS